jgi:hypothetical protein
MLAARAADGVTRTGWHWPRASHKKSPLLFCPSSSSPSLVRQCPGVFTGHWYWHASGSPGQDLLTGYCHLSLLGNAAARVGRNRAMTAPPAAPGQMESCSSGSGPAVQWILVGYFVTHISNF